MRKSELVQALAGRFPELKLTDTHQSVETVIQAIGDALASKGRVEIRNFGSFGVRQRKAMRARNPKTGQKVQIDSKAIPFFKVGKDLRIQVRENDNTNPTTEVKALATAQPSNTVAPTTQLDPLLLT